MIISRKHKVNHVTHIHILTLLQINYYVFRIAHVIIQRGTRLEAHIQRDKRRGVLKNGDQAILESIA